MRGAALAVAALALTACVEVTPAVVAKHPAPPAPKTQMAALETRIYQLVEKEREKIDPRATPLTRNAELDAVARAHSEDMAKQHYLAHRSPDGQTSTSILMARDAKFHGMLGENIAAEYFTKAGGVDVETYAKRFVALWLGSKPHRDNLALADYSRTGIGAAVGDDTIYVTQLFAADPAPGDTHHDQHVAPGRDVQLRAVSPKGKNLREVH